MGRRELLLPNGLAPSSLSPAAGGEPLLPPSATGAQRWPHTASGHPPLWGAADPIQRPLSLPGVRARSLGAAKVRTVGPRGALSIPRDLEEAEASGRTAQGMEETGADIFPGKVSGKRMARGMEETSAGGLTPPLAPFLLVPARAPKRVGKGAIFRLYSRSRRP
jgi:hypothetical protein